MGFRFGGISKCFKICNLLDDFVQHTSDWNQFVWALFFFFVKILLFKCKNMVLLFGEKFMY